jgi:hypothetical protein
MDIKIPFEIFLYVQYIKVKYKYLQKRSTLMFGLFEQTFSEKVLRVIYHGCVGSLQHKLELGRLIE